MTASSGVWAVSNFNLTPERPTSKVSTPWIEKSFDTSSAQRTSTIFVDRNFRFLISRSSGSYIFPNKVKVSIAGR